MKGAVLQGMHPLPRPRIFAVAKKRRVVLMSCDYGSRPPLTRVPNESELLEEQRAFDEARRSDDFRWVPHHAVDPAVLIRSAADDWPITLELMQRLNQWAEEWEFLAGTGVLHTGPSPTQDQWQEFYLRGRELAEELQSQLGSAYEVRYEYTQE